MKKEELKPIFEKPFQGVESFKNNIITSIFGSISPLNKSFKNQFNNLEKDIFEDVICFGKLELATDGDEMQFFDVVLRPNVMLSRNRVTIQNFIRRELLPYNAALIVFHYPDNGGEWRISFVSKGKNAADSTSAKRYTYLLGEKQTCRTAAERFEILSNKDKTLENITDAFSVEKLSDEFFDKYRSMYADFVQFITGKRFVKEEGKWVEKKIDEADEQLQSSFNGDEKSVRDYIKKMLGRLVFLQFLQKKGWLGVPVDKEWGEGNQHYLQNLFANSDAKDDFLDAVLEILFFDTLNANRDNQLGDPVLGDNIKIPYLNGGLFERDELDEKIVKFPADLFKELLQFFSEYNFTIDENDPNDAEVGVDPEMLGRIFENLLEDNKDKGAFYTPKEIVQYMCRESLISYLSTDSEFMADKIRILVTEYCTETLSDDEKQLLDTKLKEVKICDPAIGSGAFPMGMLNEIYRCRVAIEGKSDKVSEIKKHIIQQSIYGVDIEQGAVDIARLRFWLALVVDEEKPQPLPNLDYKIMQGNSLLESFEGIDLSKLSSTNLAVVEPQYDLFGNLENNQLSISYTNSEDVQRLQNYIKSYFDVENHDRKYELKQLIDNEIHTQIDLAISKYEEGIQFKIENFGTEAKRSTKQQKEIDALNNELIQLANKRKKLEELQNTNIKPFFLWKLYFKEVFDENKRGFDICIGNPPYVRQERLSNEYKTILISEFPDVGNGIADLYVYFFGLGLKILSPKGVMMYITLNKYLKTLYGKELRNTLSNKVDIDLIIDFFELPVFQASTDSAITKVLNNKTDILTRYFPIKTLENLDLFEVTKGYYQTTIKEETEWKFIDSTAQSILNKMYVNTITLKEFGNDKIFRGITTGANHIFIIDEKTKNSIIEFDANSKKHIHNYIEPTKIKKWQSINTNKYIIGTFPSLNLNIDEFYGIKNYLEKYRLELEPKPKVYCGTEWQGRKAGNYEWYEIQDNIAYCKFFTNPKIVYIHTAVKHEFYLDYEGRYINNSCYMIISDSKFLFSFLNSRLFEWFKKIKFVAYGDGAEAGRCKLDYNKMITVPIKKNVDETPFIKLVDDIQSAKRTNPDTDTSEFENKIENLIYELYGFTDEEIKIIES